MGGPRSRPTWPIPKNVPVKLANHTKKLYRSVDTIIPWNMSLLSQKQEEKDVEDAKSHGSIHLIPSM